MSTEPEDASSTSADELASALERCRADAEARQRSATGQSDPGRIHVAGPGVGRDGEVAACCVRKAATRQDFRAQFFLGAMHQAGVGVARDGELAAFWFERSVEEGIQSLALADLLLALAELGLPGKELVLGLIPGSGSDRMTKEAADVGHIDAQPAVGDLCDGWEGTKDVDQAPSWYLDAAERGSAAAQYRLGGCHLVGRGVERSEAAAVPWFRKAAGQGLVDAQHVLALLYEEAGERGDLSEGDALAAFWHLKAATQGDDLSRIRLAMLLARRRGDTRTQRAIAAEMGDYERGIVTAPEVLVAIRRMPMSHGALDIKAKAPYPAGALSNFAPHAFTIDGVACGSMEGFLQGLKIADLEEQRRVCALVGAEAQDEGRRHDWSSGTLWWRGEPIDRLSEAYQSLLDRAYGTLFVQSRRFRVALADTGTLPLEHSIGKTDPCDTILTVDEFRARLEELRSQLQRSNQPEG